MFVAQQLHWQCVSKWRLLSGALACSLLTTYLLFIATLLSDRGKDELTISRASEEDNDAFDQREHSSHSQVDPNYPANAPIRLWTKQSQANAIRFMLDESGLQWRLPPEGASEVHRFRRSLMEAKMDHVTVLANQSEKSVVSAADEDLNCDHLLSFIPRMSFLSSGWTKAVYRVRQSNAAGEHSNYANKDSKNADIAVKMIDLMGHDMNSCVNRELKLLLSSTAEGGITLDGERIDEKEEYAKDEMITVGESKNGKQKNHQKDEAKRKKTTAEEDADEREQMLDNNAKDNCYRKSAAKMLKEIVLLTHMKHPNVVKVLGYCVPNRPVMSQSQAGVAILTELGEPIDLIKLLQLSWEDRLRIVLDMARLLEFLSRTSAWGSVVMNDFRRQQFVLVNGRLKLSDLDDVGLDEPICAASSDCLQLLSNATENAVNTENFNQLRVTCEKGYCKGMNELRNIYNAAKHFTPILPYGVPPQLQPRVNRLIEAFKSLSHSARDLLKAAEEIADIYSTGKYMNRVAEAEEALRKQFLELPNSDLLGLFDYSCKQSMSQVSCVLSVANLEEAYQVCAAHNICRAFVWTNEKTWTGRRIVHFKRNFTTPVRSDRTSLYLKSAGLTKEL